MRDVLLESLGALLPEPQVPVHVLVLVIAPQQEDLLRVLQLQSHQQTYGLERISTTVYVVAQEDIIEAVNVAMIIGSLPNVEESHEISKVAVNASENLDRRFNVSDNYGLDCQNVDTLSGELDDVLALDREFR